MVFRAGAHRKEAVWAPGEFVPAVAICGLCDAQDDPHDVSNHMHAAAEDKRATARDEQIHKEELEGMGVFTGDTDGINVSVVDFVDIWVNFVPVEESVSPVKAEVFNQHRENCLPNYFEARRKRLIIHAVLYVFQHH